MHVLGAPVEDGLASPDDGAERNVGEPGLLHHFPAGCRSICLAWFEPAARRRPDGVSTPGFDIVKEEDTVGGVEQNNAGGNTYCELRASHHFDARTPLAHRQGVAARRAGLEFLEKLLTKLTSAGTTERNAGMLGIPAPSHRWPSWRRAHLLQGLLHLACALLCLRSLR
jgi:hypothetical protein